MFKFNFKFIILHIFCCIFFTSSINAIMPEGATHEKPTEAKKVKIKPSLKQFLKKAPAKTEAQPQPQEPQLPIIYSPEYNFRVFGIEKVHHFDAQKFQRIHQHLLNMGITPYQFHVPTVATMDDLAKVHSPQYLQALEHSASAKVAFAILGLPVPNFASYFLGPLVRSRVLHPMKLATGGTVLGAELALKEGWAINLSGGYHHAKGKGFRFALNSNPDHMGFDEGDGFCIYADIPLAIEKVWEKDPKKKVLIVDLDAHQGNGHEGYFHTEVNVVKDGENLGPNPQSRVAILDMYSKYNYPRDTHAQQAIAYDFPLATGMQDESYLRILNTHLAQAINDFKPDLIIYNAGTDIYEKDPLGRLGVSRLGIITRDARVFELARAQKVPILMVLSGGYTKESADIIGSSIENILKNILKVFKGKQQ